jgi:hypothetical protein
MREVAYQLKTNNIIYLLMKGFQLLYKLVVGLFTFFVFACNCQWACKIKRNLDSCVCKSSFSQNLSSKVNAYKGLGFTTKQVRVVLDE